MLQETNATNNATKTLIVYHSADTDGISSALISKRVMHMIEQNKSITYNEEFIWKQVGYNYGKDPEIDTWLNLFDDSNNDLMYNHIQFIDCTPPLFFIEKCIPLLNSGKLTMDIFDHHQSAYNEINNLFETKSLVIQEFIRYFFDNKYCGSFIYWNSVINRTDWIFDTYGFLFNKINEPKVTGLFIDFIKQKQKPVQEWLLIKKNIETEIRDYINTQRMYDFFSTISKWDTWGWYNDEPKLRDLKCLYMNEFVMYHWRSMFQENLDRFYNWFFEEKEFKYFPNSMISKGSEIYNFNCDIAKQTKHTVVNFDNKNFVVINKHANYYDTEEVKLKYSLLKNSGEEIFAVIYYTVSLTTGKANLSMRALNHKINCSETIKKLTSGNGGGHRGSAGGQMDISVLISLVKNSKLNDLKTPEDLLNYCRKLIYDCDLENNETITIE